MSIPRRHVRALMLVVLALLSTLVLTLPGPAAGQGSRPNPIGSDKFNVGAAYRGDFPDPSVIKVGRLWYAYSTTTANLNLPVMRSSNLSTWQALGEGLKKPARWAAKRKAKGHPRVTLWAPHVARVGKRFVAYYSTRVKGTKRKMCIAVATSKRPGKGFVDRSRRPLVCPSTRGAIDPSYFRAPDGRSYLVWKSEQTRAYKAQIHITPLSRNGLRVTGYSKTLLQVQDPWEWVIIENPSMIGYGGRWYLFYSGSSYADDRYATGYAICETYVGPCTRASSEPLLATGGRVSGPGGAMAFYDTAKRLRLAYAAWDYGNTGYPNTAACRRQPGGCPQRKLHVATLGLSTDPAAPPGTLVVTERG